MKSRLNLYSLVILAIIAILPVMVAAQEVGHSQLKLLSQSYGDSIVLRWAPTTPLAWRLLNRYGYRLERFTIVRDSIVLSIKETVSLHREPLMPAKQEAWEKYTDTNDYVAVAAQAIFGDEFQVSKGNDLSIGEVATKANELESRYSYTLFAADMSSVAATLSALRWVDKNVDKRERYLYRVYSQVPMDILKIDFGYVYQDAKRISILPQPPQPNVVAEDRVVRIEWDPAQLSDFYTGYYLEKSLNGGKDFTAVNKFPLVGILTDAGYQKIVVTDSVENSWELNYRLRGTNPFADKGPYSPVIKVSGKEGIKSPVVITKAFVTEVNTVKIQWQVREEDRLIERFEIERAPKESGPYRVIYETKPGDREMEDKIPLTTSYYRVAMVGKSRDRLVTYPYLIQLADSIPPAVPAEISGIASTDGIVTLGWRSNNEPDLQGYQVYRSEFKNAEFSLVSKNLVAENKFIDSLQIQSTGKQVYYKVKAVDIRFNTSDFSDEVKVLRPDRTPPAAPVIEALRVDGTSVHVCWKNSSSNDVVAHSVFRQVAGRPWELVRRVPVADSSCVKDASIISGSYRYKIEAKDTTGLTSESSIGQLTVKLAGNAKTKPLLRGLVDREVKQVKLSWVLKSTDVTKYLIYRASNDSPLSLYSSTNGVAEFVDNKVVINTTYKYVVKAIFRDGHESLFSDLVAVKF